MRNKSHRHGAGEAIHPIRREAVLEVSGRATQCGPGQRGLGERALGQRGLGLGAIALCAWLAAFPIAAHADYMSNARDSLKKGDLKSAQIDLRNAVRNDPQNAEAHYLLGRVSIELGDPVAAEREADAARQRGFDPHQAIPLLTQALLAQGKYQKLLDDLKPDGRDPTLDAAILVSRGYALIGLKKPDDAQKAFAEAQQAAPNAVEPLLADARLSVARADLNGAQAKIDQAIAAQPKSVEALLAKAQLLRLKNDGPGAMAVLDDLITSQPSAMQAHLDRASLALAMNKNDLAKADIEAVLKGTPGNVQAIYLAAVMEAQAGHFDVADKDLEKIAGFIGRIQRAFYLQAVVKEQLGQLEQAEEAARKYLARFPNDIAGYKVLARVEFAKKRPDLVIDTLGKVAESGKGDAETYDLLGRAYTATNRPTDAVAAFQKAQAMAPNDVGLQTRLASARMGMGDVDAAMGDLEHTLQLVPKAPAVGEALFFASLASGDMDKAADALAKVKEMQGETEVTGNLEGLLHLARTELPEAKTTFEALIKKYPDFSPAKVNLARIVAMLGDQPRAETLLADVLTKDPTSEPALTMAIFYKMQNGRVADAITIMQKAHAAAPTNPGMTANLGELYIRNGEPQKALDLALAEKAPMATAVEIYSLKAAAYLALGRKKEARDTYTDLLKQDANIVGARRQLVALEIEAGDFEAARGVLTEGIAANPTNYQLYQDLAMIDLKSTGVEAALATADRLLGQDRDFADLRALKGDLYLAANRPNDAADAYQKESQAHPSSMLTVRLAGALMRSGRTDAATKMLIEWVNQHQDDVAVEQQLSEILLAGQQYSDAAIYLESVLKKKPYDAIALNNLAWIYQQKGDERALATARRAYVLAPNAQTADTLGWILVTTGNPTNGVALLRQATTEASTDPRVVYHYAVALKDTGDKNEAIKALTVVVGLKGTAKEKEDAQRLLTDLKGS
jgi:putative PEP-CTERM system TPR-repeat lipoprotein